MRVLANTRWRKSQRGAAALEFAIVLPVLLLLLVGIVDFGLVFGAQSQVANAAREGARTGALTGKKTLAESAARAGLTGLPGAANVGTTAVASCTKDAGTCSLTDTTSDTGNTITVTVTYVHTWLSPVLLGFSPTITLQGQSQMRIEA